MSAQIDNISLFIPHVFVDYSEEYIKSMIEEAEIGCVDHIDLVPKMDMQGTIYNTVYIHFKYWYTGEIAKNFQEEVKNPNKEARIYNHYQHWFWVVLENTTKKHSKHRIDLSEPIKSIDATASAATTDMKIAPGLDDEFVRMIEENRQLIEENRQLIEKNQKLEQECGEHAKMMYEFEGKIVALTESNDRYKIEYDWLVEKMKKNS